MTPREGSRRANSFRRRVRRLAWVVDALEPRMLLASAPTVFAGPASAITATGATLSATLTPGGSAATVAFQYSTDPSFSPTSPTVRYSAPPGFSDPSGVAVDAAGDLFVSDEETNSVTEVKPDGSVSTVGSGFSKPDAVAVDASGDVFVADSGTGSVKEVKPDGSVTTVGPGFGLPHALAVDAKGDVFVADSYGGDIIEIKPDGTSATVGSGLQYPTGVAVDAEGDVFAVDDDHNLVKEFKPDGTSVTVGSGFNAPGSVAVDGSGDVFVTDTTGIQEVKPDGSIVSVGQGITSPGSLTTDASGDLFLIDGTSDVVKEVKPNGSTSTLGPQPTEFEGVAVDSMGDIFFLNGAAGTVDEVKPDGSTSTVASGLTDAYSLAIDPSGDLFTIEYTGNSTSYTQSSLVEIKPDGSTSVVDVESSGASGLAVDSHGDLFVIQTGQGLVVEVKPDGSRSTVASGFDIPEGLAVDASGDLFLTDGGQAFEVKPGSSPIGIGSGLNQADAVAVDASGDVFIAGGNTLTNSNSIGTDTVQEIKPDGSIATLASSPSGVPLGGVAVDAMGNVYYTDPAAGKVVELSPSSVAGDVSAASVSGTLTDLQPGTTYYYRAIATAADGTESESAVGSFATAAPADLFLSQSATPALVFPSGYAIYTMTVTNFGPLAVDDVTLIDTLPADSTLVNAVPSQGGFASLSGFLLIDDLGTLAPGASATLTIIVAPTTAGPAVNLAVAAAPDDPGSSPSVAIGTTYVPSGPAVLASIASKTSIAVVFDEPITPTSAKTKTNYKLFALGKSARALTVKDKPIAIKSVAYLPGSQIVSLTPSTTLIPGEYYELKVIGSKPGGVADTAGRKLVGGPDQVPGTDAIVMVDH